MEKSFFYQSFNIRYRDLGEGLPVVLLHGFGEDSHIWDEQIHAIHHDYRVIAPDLPGSGESMPIGPDFTGQVRNGLPSSIDAMGEAIYQLLVQEGIEQCVLLGHSMGGYTALGIAEHYPGLLAGLGLINSSAFADSEEKTSTRKKAIEFISNNGGHAFLQTAIPGLFSETFISEQPGVVAAQIAQFDPRVANKEATDAALIAYYEAMIQRPDRTKVLEGLEVPVLFIIGPEDKAVPMDDVLKQVELPATRTVQVIEKTAHMSMKEAPGLLNQYILKFLSEIKGS